MKLRKIRKCFDAGHSVYLLFFFILISVFFFFLFWTFSFLELSNIVANMRTNENSNERRWVHNLHSQSPIVQHIFLTSLLFYVWFVSRFDFILSIFVFILPYFIPYLRVILSFSFILLFIVCLQFTNRYSVPHRDTEKVDFLRFHCVNKTLNNLILRVFETFRYLNLYKKIYIGIHTAYDCVFPSLFDCAYVIKSRNLFDFKMERLKFFLFFFVRTQKRKFYFHFRYSFSWYGYITPFNCT